MLRSLKTILGAGLLALTVLNAGAFALLGPVNEVHQIPVMSYDIGADIGAPKNLGEEYRWNIPVLYYSFDEAFLDYFGSNGVAAVDEAFAFFNLLPPVSSLSADLSEFPLEAKRVNFQAQALQMYDLKSRTMSYIAEQVGLAEPDRWVWGLRTRVPISPPGCPAMTYSVIKRNFDPVSWEPSTYVNGTLYTYVITEGCDPGDAVEVLLDPLALQFSAVAARATLPGDIWSRCFTPPIGSSGNAIASASSAAWR